MTRAERRHQAATAKSKAARVLKQHKVTPDAAMVGRAAAMHNTCPCWMCQNQSQEPTRQQMSDFNKLHKGELT